MARTRARSVRVGWCAYFVWCKLSHQLPTSRPVRPFRDRDRNDHHTDLPLEGLLVVDMSQFPSGPYCSLRMLDLGARVIKIERPAGGDLSRRLYLSDTEIGGDSTIFHAINRGKESLAIDMKNPADIWRSSRSHQTASMPG